MTGVLIVEGEVLGLIDFKKTTPLVRSPSQDRLADYWLAKCQGEKLPTLKDIEPIELADILPLLFFVNVEFETGQMRLQYGITGAGGVRLAMREVTGRWFHDLYSDEEIAQVASVASEAFESKMPVLYKAHMLNPSRNHVDVSVLACPLSDNGEDLTGLVLLLHPLES